MKRLFLLITVVVAGCSPYSSELDCGVGRGMPCASLYKVNKAVDRGHIDFQLEEDAPLEQHPTTPLSLRSPAKVWVAPYHDKAGHYHQAQVIEVGDGT